MFSIPKLHYSEMRRFAEGRMELTRREREARIEASGGDVEKYRRKESAKQHHRNTVSAKRDKLRRKWGVAGGTT